MIEPAQIGERVLAGDEGARRRVDPVIGAGQQEAQRRAPAQDRQRGFLKILQLGPQHLAIFIQLLQRFVAVDQITVRSDPKLHVLVALEGKFFIVELEYLAGLLLPVEEVLHICL